jgi:hypothetical protein
VLLEKGYTFHSALAFNITELASKDPDSYHALRRLALAVSTLDSYDIDCSQGNLIAISGMAEFKKEEDLPLFYPLLDPSCLDNTDNICTGLDIVTRFPHRSFIPYLQSICFVSLFIDAKTCRSVATYA